MMWGYNGYYNDYGMSFGFVKLLIPFVLFDLIIRGFALWRSARKEQNIWFIALLVVNSMGILPLIYLILNRDEPTSSKKTKKSK